MTVDGGVAAFVVCDRCGKRFPQGRVTEEPRQFCEPCSGELFRDEHEASR